MLKMATNEEVCMPAPIEFESDDDNNSEGWSEMNIDNDVCLICLFCTRTFKTMAVALGHLQVDHSLDLSLLKHKFKMDCYSYICLINYIRKNNASPETIASASTPLWNEKQYLVPALPDDPWLMFDFDELEAAPPEGSKTKTVVITEEEYSMLTRTISSLRSVIDEQAAQLRMAASDITTMKQATQEIVSGIGDDSINIGKLRITDDFSYFNSYSHFGIHHTMLSDKPRTSSYRDAILKNGESFAGKTVLDVGCGSGILSMFCVQAGAASVFGVDQSDIIYNAMDIIRENGMENKINLVKGRVESIDLGVDKVDIIVSEWMGYFLLFEGMLDAVICARDRFLAPGGLLLPNLCSLHLVGLSDPDSYSDHIGFWSDVYGYKMTSLRKEVLKEAYATTANAATVATAPVQILSLDLMTCSVESTCFTSEFVLVSERDCKLTAVCGYFDTVFQLPHSVTLSTSPCSEKTHWGQTVFYLSQPVHVTKGMSIPGKIKCSKKDDNPRSLVIDITLAGNSSSYYLG